MANNLSLTKFTSKCLGTFLRAHSPMIATSYRGVQEFNDHGSYGTQDTVDIKIPGYPTVQRGLSVTAEDIIDRVVPYTISDNDIYNVTYSFDIRTLGLQVVGGELALSGDPNVVPDKNKEINPQAKTFIDKYVYPAGAVIRGDLEKEVAEKARKAAFYTPIDTPAALGAVNTYSAISSVEALQDKLGFISSRMGVMNNDDAKAVADSLQNMFNESFNKNITLNARLGGPTKGRLAGQDIYVSNSLETTAECPQFSVTPNITVASVAADGSTITFSGVDTVTSVLITAGTMISIPSVFLINKVNKVVTNVKLVVTASADANGDGAGNVTVTLSEPLAATGMQANVDSLPAASAPAEIFPAHKNNYFYVPMGIIANPVELGMIHGAQNDAYTMREDNISVRSYVQGVVGNGVNTYRMSCCCPTLAIPSYIINLPSAI